MSGESSEILQEPNIADNLVYMTPAVIITLISGALSTWKIVNDSKKKQEQIVEQQTQIAPSISKTPKPGNESAETIKSIITEEARKQGLNPKIALLFAFLESRYTNKLGDTNWPFKRDETGKTNWEKYVLNSKTLKYNPYVDEKELWISYGPFQILSAFHIDKIDATASPLILLDVRTNAAVAIQIIKKLQRMYGNNLEKMRLAYVCGNLTELLPTGKCKQETADAHVSILKQHAPKFGLYS